MGSEASSQRTPQWVADSARKECQRCSAEFGVFCRRHHCRSCGDVFCDIHCNAKIPLPEGPYNAIAGIARVCDGCLVGNYIQSSGETEVLRSLLEAVRNPPPATAVTHPVGMFEHYPSICAACGHTIQTSEEAATHAESCRLRQLLGMYIQLAALLHQPTPDPIDLSTCSQRLIIPAQEEGNRDEGSEGPHGRCTVCFELLSPGEDARLLPCRHCYHTPCIDKWFLEHSSCPLCRSDPRHPPEEGAAGSSVQAHD